MQLLQSLMCQVLYFVFKNMLLSQRHTTFHIHYRGYKTSKEKHSAIAEKNRSLLKIDHWKFF